MKINMSKDNALRVLEHYLPHLMDEEPVLDENLRKYLLTARNAFFHPNSRDAVILY